ncbi:hypothetical protein PATSB16_28010 [Pandoraea thiooxydans]|uniref:Uncharacterized protein n=1 Tax=Pandoraea thiooxydans TaxID=445709 RepID=A0A0G3EVD0_9BURK|nr:hypothetical protein [Pandoraea thiooxydans]AKJ68701.1 hypothetical protein ABW99_11230 [Pandoraea thiooxydans]APR96141.1 hypothetical protein PATSB16_28010 [Pandoraea thiooxydans]
MRSFFSVFNSPAPEKLAEKELQEMRLTLFQAERRLLEAQLQVDYYRNLIGFLEEVSTVGVESVADKQKAAPQAPRVAPVAPNFVAVSSAA